MTTILWRDIPAQVIASAGDATERVLLSSRFQKAIDKAARVAGLTERHAYLQQWRRSVDILGEDQDVIAVAHALAATLEEDLDRDALASLVRAGGVRADSDVTDQARSGGNA
ncbi:MAG: virulence factor [Nitriliruptoraceae bacterium]